jgi:hypothetical protein
VRPQKQTPVLPMGRAAATGIEVNQSSQSKLCFQEPAGFLLSLLPEVGL